MDEKEIKFIEKGDMFTKEEIARIFELDKVEKQFFYELVPERRKLRKIQEREQKEFINLLKSWIKKWKKKKSNELRK